MLNLVRLYFIIYIYRLDLYLNCHMNHNSKTLQKRLYFNKPVKNISKWHLTSFYDYQWKPNVSSYMKQKRWVYLLNGKPFYNGRCFFSSRTGFSEVSIVWFLRSVCSYISLLSSSIILNCISAILCEGKVFYPQNKVINLINTP